MNDDETTLTLSVRECATLVAALAYWQWKPHNDTNPFDHDRLAAIEDIADGAGGWTALDHDEIDALSLRLAPPVIEGL